MRIEKKNDTLWKERKLLYLTFCIRLHLSIISFVEEKRERNVFKLE